MNTRIKKSVNPCIPVKIRVQKKIKGGKMKLSTKSRYGTRAVLEIGRHKGDGASGVNL